MSMLFKIARAQAMAVKLPNALHLNGESQRAAKRFPRSALLESTCRTRIIALEASAAAGAGATEY